MTPDTGAAIVRRCVVGVNLVGIAGMIVTSITERNDGALAFGLLTAAGSVCLLVATAIAPPVARLTDEEMAALARRLAARVEQMAARGADEEEVSDLVRDAVRLGRAERLRPRGAHEMTPTVHADRAPHR